MKTIVYSKYSNTRKHQQDALVVQGLELLLPMQGVQVWSLIGELRAHMPLAKTHKTEAVL